MFALGSAAVPRSTGCCADAGRTIEGLSGPDDKNISSLDPDAMMKSWMSGSGSGMEQMQRAFWSQFGSQFGAGSAQDAE